MRKIDVSKLSWKIYRWMIEEHYLPGEQLTIFAFIYEYSGNDEISNYDVIKQLFVKKSGFSELALEDVLKHLISKQLIEASADGKLITYRIKK